jgi:hypothetical protein
MAILRGLFATLVFCGIAVGVFVGGYSWLYPNYTIRYCLTVSTEMEGHARSGSSVVEVVVKKQPRLLDSPGWAFRVNGEAVFVDIGDGRNLVALLAPGPSKGTDAIGILFKAFRIPFIADHALELRDKAKGERSIDPADWPAFVTFRDIRDPLSVEMVNPSAGKEPLDGVRVVSVMLTITGDPVSHSLAGNLPWLAASLNNQDSLALAKHRLGRRNFIQE